MRQLMPAMPTMRMIFMPCSLDLTGVVMRWELRFTARCRSERGFASRVPRKHANDVPARTRERMTPTEKCWAGHSRQAGGFPRPCRSWWARLADLLHRLAATIAGLRRRMTALRALVLVCHGGIPPHWQCEGLRSFLTSTKQER